MYVWILLAHLTCTCVWLLGPINLHGIVGLGCPVKKMTSLLTMLLSPTPRSGVRPWEFCLLSAGSQGLLAV